MYCGYLEHILQVHLQHIFLMLKSTYIDASSKTIDTLIEGGFLRHKRNADGEIEILKWNAIDEDV